MPGTGHLTELNTVEVGSDGYDAATVHPVLRTLQVVVDAQDHSSYWTLAIAFG